MEDAGNFLNPRNLSRKVVAVAAGEAHTLLLTGKAIQETSTFSDSEKERGSSQFVEIEISYCIFGKFLSLL